MRKIMEIKLSSISPASIGGYDTFADAIPRLTSIRGISRWWARALIGGWAYDNQYDIIDTIQKIIPRIFGGQLKRNNVEEHVSSLLDFRFESISRKSTLSQHFRIDLLFMKLNTAIRRASSRRDGKVRESLEELEKMCKFSPRIREIIYIDLKKAKDRFNRMDWSTLTRILRSIREKLLRALLMELEFKLIVYSKARVPTNSIVQYEYLGALSIVLALALGCIGKISRRGLGSFKIDILDTKLEELNDITGLVETLPSSARELIRSLRNITNEVMNYLSKQIVIKKVDSVKLPLISVITNNIVEHVPMFSIWLKENVNNVYDEIKRLFLVTQHGSLARNLKFARKGKQSIKLAWYLGLPRSVKGAGYIESAVLKKENTKEIRMLVERRASPLHVKVFKNCVMILHFVSKDWPSEIIWRGATTQKIKISDNKILMAASIVNNCLKELQYTKIYPL